MGGISFGLSPKTQREAEAKAQGEAIKSFQNRAQQLSSAFGFGSYNIREVMYGIKEKHEDLGYGKHKVWFRFECKIWAFLERSKIFIRRTISIRFVQSTTY